MKPVTPDALEVLLGTVLRWGLRISTSLLGVGLCLELLGQVPGLSAALVRLGLIVLIATPVARVIVSVIQYGSERDWLFLTLTLLVLVILLGSLIVALV